jgi:hypothetical protein
MYSGTVMVVFLGHLIDLTTLLLRPILLQFNQFLNVFQFNDYDQLADVV